MLYVIKRGMRTKMNDKYGRIFEEFLTYYEQGTLNSYKHSLNNLLLIDSCFIAMQDLNNKIQ